MFTPRSLLLGGVASVCLSALAAHAQSPALPTGGAYAAGAGAGRIATSGSTLTITQSGARGVINWQSFSIGAGGTVQFYNGTGATLNRVTGGNSSQIYGQLNATGSVYLINPTGVVVGPGGTVVTGGSFVASTRDVADSQFMAGGTLSFAGNSAGGVSNQGRIVSQNGDVVLIGQTVSNTGGIHAPDGTAALAAGNQVVLSAAGGPAGVYVVPDASAKGNASNSGLINAAAVALASAGGNVYALAGNRTGLIQATGTQAIDGQVWLTAPNGRTSVNGTVTAQNVDGSGGTIVANGRNVVVHGGATLSASGTRGGTVLVGVSAPGGANEAQRTTIHSGARITATGNGAGTGGHIETSGQTLSLGAAKVTAGSGGGWVLDPINLMIDATAATMIDAALTAGTNVTELTTATSASGAGNQVSGAGDITIAAPMTWGSGATLTLSAFNNINIDAAVSITGAGGLALTTGNNSGGTSATIAALNFSGGNVSYTGTGGSLTINSVAYKLETSLTTLASDISANASGKFALATSIDVGATTYAHTPIPTTFTGNFEGLGNGISNLTISSADANVGLFAQTGVGANIRHLALIGGSVTGTAANANVGALVGSNQGGVINASTSTSVTGSGTGSNVGGLIGYTSFGTLTNASASGTVTGGASASVGGLVGSVEGGSITSGFATGAVSGGASAFVGGLVGYGSLATITDSYASGAVSGGAGATVGGLAGFSGFGTVTDVYATGGVSGGSTTGGLIGSMEGGKVADAYATGAVSSAGSQLGGLVGSNSLGTITQVYASGAVSGGAGTTGGVLGVQGFGGSMSAAYWNEDRSGTTTGVGSGAATGTTGLVSTGASPFTASSYTALTFTTTPGAQGNAWVMVDVDGTLNNAGGAASATMPMLASEYATTIVNAHQLQLMAMAPTASYTLGGNVNTAATGTSSSPATGTDVWKKFGFAPGGQGYTITGLTIAAAETNVGLFGQVGTGGVVSNVNLSGGAVSANAASTVSSVGALVGLNGGTVSNATASASVSDSTSDSNIGGLVGNNAAAGTVTAANTTGSVSGIGNLGGLVGLNAGTISNAHSTASVSSNAVVLNGQFSGSGGVGGLVGYNSGAISASYAAGSVGGVNLYAGGLAAVNTGTVSTSYGAGSISGGGVVGGLVGWNTTGTISNAYATGTVGGGTNDGGVVGLNAGTATNIYAIGAVSGGSTNGTQVGALVGTNNGTVTNGYWDRTISGSTTGIGGGTVSGATGLTTAAWLTQGPIATGTFNTSTIWVAGYPYPVLQALPYVVINAFGTQAHGTSNPSIGLVGISVGNGTLAAAQVNTSGITWVTGVNASSSAGAYVIGSDGATAAAGYQVTTDGTLLVTAPPVVQPVKPVLPPARSRPLPGSGAVPSVPPVSNPFASSTVTVPPPPIATPITLEIVTGSGPILLQPTLIRHLTPPRPPAPAHLTGLF
jgi:filamentous hemagglutinin family protein